MLRIFMGFSPQSLHRGECAGVFRFDFKTLPREGKRFVLHRFCSVAARNGLGVRVLLYTDGGVIAVLQGEVIEATPLSVVIDVSGVGYEVHVPVSTAERVPPTGGRVKLFIHDVYREDGQDLYGFIRREERDFFRMLVEKVSGIGPRTAIALLSKLSMPMLSGAIAAGDVNTLARTPGIGKKTAERLVVELRDKMQAFSGSFGAPVASLAGGSSLASLSGEFTSPVCDAVNALVALGYKADAADKAVQKALKNLGPEATTELLLRAALSA